MLPLNIWPFFNLNKGQSQLHSALLSRWVTQSAEFRYLRTFEACFFQIIYGRTYTLHSRHCLLALILREAHLWWEEKSQGTSCCPSVFFCCLIPPFLQENTPLPLIITIAYSVPQLRMYGLGLVARMDLWVAFLRQRPTTGDTVLWMVKLFADKSGCSTESRCDWPAGAETGEWRRLHLSDPATTSTWLGACSTGALCVTRS